MKNLDAERRKSLVENTISLLRRNPRMQRYWARLGFLSLDPDLRLSCYCRAMTAAIKMNNPAGLRMRLALMMHARGDDQEARCELAAVARFHNEGLYPIDDDTFKILNMPWAQGSCTQDNTWYYADRQSTADQLVFGDIPEEAVLVTRVDEKLDLCHYITAERAAGVFKTEGLPFAVKPDYLLSVRLQCEEVLTCRPEENPTLRARFFKTFQGRIALVKREIPALGTETTGKFGDVFIPRPLLDEARITMDGTRVIGNAIAVCPTPTQRMPWMARHIMIDE